MAAKALVLHHFFAPRPLPLTSAPRLAGTWASLAVAIAKYVASELESAKGRKTALANTVSALFRKCIRKAEESGRVAGALLGRTRPRSCSCRAQLSSWPPCARTRALEP